MAIRAIYVVLAGFLLSDCSGTTKLRVADVPQDWFNAPLILAIRGWPGNLPADGVTSFALASGLASKTAVASGSADIGLASPVVLLRDAATRDAIKLLGCYMRSSEVLGIASRTAQPQPPFGYVSGTISEVYLAHYLIKSGQGDALREGKVDKVGLLPPMAGLALKSGLTGKAINSVVIWEPQLSVAAARVDGRVLLDPSLYTVNVCLIANRNSYDSALRRQIDAFVARVAQASAYITAKPDEARETIERQASLDPGSLQQPWSRVDFHFTKDPARLVTILREEAQAIDEAGMQTARPDPAAWVR